MSTLPEQLCKNYPEEFAKYIRYCWRLGFEEEPDYDLLRKLFRDLFYRCGFTADWGFDWYQKGINVTAMTMEKMDYLSTQLNIHQRNNNSIINNSNNNSNIKSPYMLKQNYKTKRRNSSSNCCKPQNMDEEEYRFTNDELNPLKQHNNNNNNSNIKQNANNIGCYPFNNHNNKYGNKSQIKQRVFLNCFQNQLEQQPPAYKKKTPFIHNKNNQNNSHNNNIYVTPPINKQRSDNSNGYSRSNSMNSHSKSNRNRKYNNNNNNGFYGNNNSAIYNVYSHPSHNSQSPIPPNNYNNNYISPTNQYVQSPLINRYSFNKHLNQPQFRYPHQQHNIHNINQQQQQQYYSHLMQNYNTPSNSNSYSQSNSQSFNNNNNNKVYPITYQNRSRNDIYDQKVNDTNNVAITHSNSNHINNINNDNSIHDINNINPMNIPNNNTMSPYMQDNIMNNNHGNVQDMLDHKDDEKEKIRGSIPNNAYLDDAKQSTSIAGLCCCILFAVYIHACI